MNLKTIISGLIYRRGAAPWDAHFFIRATLSPAAAILLAAGCASEKVEWRKYPATTIAELSLPKNASLRIVPSKNETAQSFAVQLRKTLASVDGVRIAAETEPATHVVFIQGGSAFRYDTPDEAKYTGRVEVETKTSDAGSYQQVRREHSVTHSAVRELSIAVYEAKTLSPVCYLTFPIFEGGVNEVGALGAGEAAEENRRAQTRFAKLAAERLEEIFAIRRRTIGVPVPVEANGDLKVKFIKIESEVLADDDEELQKTLSAIDALAANPSVIPGPLEEFAETSSAKDWKPPEGTTREAILGNYYLMALRREIGCVDPDVLSEIHAEHLRILELCQGPSLRMACPIALGRLEAKIARLRAE